MAMAYMEANKPKFKIIGLGDQKDQKKNEDQSLSFDKRTPGASPSRR